METFISNTDDTDTAGIKISTSRDGNYVLRFPKQYVKYGIKISTSRDGNWFSKNGRRRNRFPKLKSARVVMETIDIMFESKF
ncbi:hypothetical protein Metvu_0773 [Methanocaldococcus vulcanius M7]|uniref:Uncharacterized protein n=1 Tax=Methanocaldococcus vulcanius (strain ATCC 700851 / DSM 12094 / M7) TaxID=579137 RepID=C9RGC9_METVM|nr:hypothetical protein [Methanocaldococcus vulcanius]ACX72631.1 hypothetical protein Metvu_0773 [Methanocaldococcus vulcanius M7]